MGLLGTAGKLGAVPVGSIETVGGGNTPVDEGGNMAGGAMGAVVCGAVPEAACIFTISMLGGGSV
jgi:hypothetical protein